LEPIGARKAGARHAADVARGKNVRDNLEDSMMWMWEDVARRWRQQEIEWRRVCGLDGRITFMTGRKNAQATTENFRALAEVT
jgi:hypothetical protein